MFLSVISLALAVAVGHAAPVPEPLVRADGLTSCAFMPDSKSILCSGEGDTNREIRVITLADLDARPPEGLWFTKQRFLTWGTTPVPFGDGKALFVRRGSREGGLWVWDFHTGEATQMRRDPFLGLPPTISRDGALVMTYRWAGRARRIGLVDPGTGKFKSIPGKDLSYPALSADGSKLLFIKEGQVWLRRIVSPLEDDESQDVQLTECELPCSWPTWGPDQATIGFVSKEFREKDDETPAVGRIGVLREASTQVGWIAENLIEPRCPAFSPDGQWMIFIAQDVAKPHDDVLWRVEVGVGR